MAGMPAAAAKSESKYFFFEKKQKTFVHSVRVVVLAT
jgi:hypothetical protein